jgi:TetR/AcrR family transcriptional regulator, regulator of autoinduction and epiphytic fitness
MSVPERRGRRYEMSNRSRQASETRSRIVAAAADLFVRDGYAATSIGAIAEQAGVAVPTVYATLRSKAGILRAVIDMTVRGDDESRPLSSRPAWQEIEREPDPREQLVKFASVHRGICDREAAIFAELEAAAGAGAEATQMLRDHDARRYETQSRLARILRQRHQLKPSMTATQAADAIWTLASERTYLALVRDRGWTPASYEGWVAEQLVAALLPAP